MLSTDNLPSDCKLSGRSLIQIKNRRGPTIDPYETQANMGN